MEPRFADKIAIVTGAGQGIGKGVAKRLAAEGAQVIIAEYNADTAATAVLEIETAGGRAAAYRIDISDAAAVRAMVADVVASWGRVDILVNNAGLVQTKPMMELTEADWDRVVDVNMRGTFFCLQAVAAQMIKQTPGEIRTAGPADIIAVKTEQAAATTSPAAALAASYGKIVNFSSVSGRRGRPLSAHYAATKAAIISITQSAALALAPYRINVNAVCPGIVPTPMWEKIDEDRASLFGARPGAAMSAFIQQVPLKRAATPEDLAGAVAFFCSTDADYITGQSLNVDGGFEMD